MQKTVLIIDDKDRSTVMRSLASKAGKKGLSLVLYQFNPGGALENDLLNHKTRELYVDKTIERYKERYVDIVFDAIACDWNLNVKNVTGVELLRQISAINSTIQATPKMMYSGTLEEELRKMITTVETEQDKDLKNKKFETLVCDIKMLVNSEFFALSGRENLQDDLLPYLMKNEPVHVRLMHVLHDHPELVFSINCGKNYSGMTFDQVRQLIEKDDKCRTELLQDLVEEAISFLEHKMVQA